MTKITKFASLLAFGLLALPAQAAPSAKAEKCVIKSHSVTAVSPYYQEQRLGRATTRRLAGALIRVQAEPGLTAEWLRLSTERHLAAMNAGAAMKDCPLAARGIVLKVESSGNGFAIIISASDTKTASEVLRRARLLQG
ncbi:MAG TPA: hypothetical protein VGP93_17560 [Polyangiaceae bacterium]|jgi:hypothetical protein|nr:hypothetical protein [Polyangiaceae bacterium]